MAQEIRREYLIYLAIKGLSIGSFSQIKLRRPLFIPTMLWEMKMWDEWVRSFSIRIMTIDSKFQSQTKSLTLNTKIDCHDNAQDRNKLMK